MDSIGSDFIDIFEIYRRYCDIRSSKDTQNLREGFSQLLKLVELRGQASSLIYDLSKLMSYLDLTVDSYRFACFYDFVFFMCREKGQKNIPIDKAIAAWKLVLKGRFRLLNEWCTFVLKYQKHNISEDTWQQVLAFSRCVHEDLEGYDPKGAWPVLIDEFVDHMHRITTSNNCSTPIQSCNCGDPEAQEGRSDDSFPGLKLFSGLKRKSEGELFNCHQSANLSMKLKRNRLMEIDEKPEHCATKLPGNTPNDQMEVVKNNALLGCSKNSPCAVEGSLAEGFAGLLSSGSPLQFDQRTRFMGNCFRQH